MGDSWSWMINRSVVDRLFCFHWNTILMDWNVIRRNIVLLWTCFDGGTRFVLVVFKRDAAFHMENKEKK